MNPSSAWVTGLVALAAGSILAADLATPRGVAAGALYVLPVLLALLSPRRTLVLEVAVVCSILTLGAYELKAPAPSGSPWPAIANRCLSVGMLWCVALLTHDRRRIGAALSRVEAESAALVDAATDAIVGIDAAGRVSRVNGAAERLFGWTALELIGQPVSRLIPAWTDPAPPAGDVQAAARDGRAFPAHLAVGRLDGAGHVAIVHDLTELRSRAQTLGVLASNLPVFVARVGPDGALAEAAGVALQRLGLSPAAALMEVGDALARARRGETARATARGEGPGGAWWLEHWIVPDGVRLGWVVWFCLDVTERRRVEARLERAARLAALGELAGNIAHEVNNPVGIISGKARLLLSSPDPLPDKARQELDKIANQCDRVARLTRKLLHYVRPGEGARAPTDVREAARRAAALVATRAERQGVRVTTALAAATPTVEADGDELEQVLLNLALNALDVMPSGGELTITVGPAPGGGAYLSVADTGPGMSEETQRRLFEPFFTTKTDHGTGLGLHICHKIVEDHGGDIEVLSALDRGSTFTVRLPAREVGPVTAAAVAS